MNVWQIDIIISDKSTLHNYVDLSDLRKLCRGDRYGHLYLRETWYQVTSCDDFFLTSQHNDLTSWHNFLTSRHDLKSQHNYRKLSFQSYWLVRCNVNLSDSYVNSSYFMSTCQIIVLSVWHSLGKNTFLRFIL